MTHPPSSSDPRLGPGPGRLGSLVDILIFVGAGAVFWGVEELLRAHDLYPFPGLFDGGMSLIASFFVVVAIMKWRKQSWATFGLRRPARWWTVPVWGLAVIVVNALVQLTIVPMLSRLPS